MSIRIKITTLILICLFNVITSYAQFEKGLFSYSNPLLLNPSFAGLNENTNIWTGVEFYRISKHEVYNQFSFTYDYFSRKHKAGLAFYLQQGLLGEINTNTIESGFTFTKQLKYRNNFIIPSVNLNLQLATKQWFVHLTDEILDKQMSPYSTPGGEIFRFYQIKPRAGILWNSPQFQVGASVMVPVGFYIASDNQTGMPESTVFTVHLKQKSRGTRKGLVSQPFKAQPYIAALFGNDQLLTRTGITIEQVNVVYSFFLQNDFSSKIHMAAGGLGWKTDNIKISALAGTGIPLLSDHFSFTGEFSLAVTIPPGYYSKLYPWAPKRNVY